MLAGLHAVAAEPRPPVTPIRADKLILVGDSTVSVHSGWGGSFCNRHVTSFLACVNLARGGRSTYNYRAEGSWEIVEREMRGGGYRHVYVLVQFGHNDQPGKPGRSTDLAREYPDNLRRYIDDIRAAGATPVLVTPLTRRQFVDGTLVDDLTPWAQAMRQVATQARVPLVDLHARSTAAVQALGPVGAMQFAQRPPSPELVAAAQGGTTADAASMPATGTTTATPTARAAGNTAVEPMGQAKLAFDYTHLGPAGADFFAVIVADELARAVPQLRAQLVP
ncbi:rhamnogalacturonan acetylesterase [Lysobacter cavernae]|uniref:Rhamnogalacturonan acetylesterase n=1 Tax=Lysobacter cavernae TaxID=1685901 RepID=A0ABV7RRP6_9GAMM